MLQLNLRKNNLFTLSNNTSTKMRNKFTVSGRLRRQRNLDRKLRLLKSVLCTTLWTFSIVLCLWVFFSFIEVTSKNLKPNPKYWKYNFFEVLVQTFPQPNQTVQAEELTTITVPTEEVTTVVDSLLEEEFVTQKAPTDSVDPDGLEMLARLIYGEAGSNSCSKYLQMYVGSVVLNRINSPDFPNTMREVIFQTEPTLQYACILETGNYWDTPTERCYEVARFLLENGSVLPENVVFQAQFKQGDGVYCKEQNTYFCYVNEEE